MIDAEGQRRQATLAFEEALDRIATGNREPTPWEADCLSAALRSMAIGNYGLAEQLISATKDDPWALSPKPSTIEELRLGLANAQGTSAAGPPAAVGLSLKMAPTMLAEIDKWANLQGVNRSEAIRRLVTQGLRSSPP